MTDPKEKMEDIMTNSSSKKCEKYALRPRSTIKKQKPEQFQPDFIPKRTRRLKPKTSPLSKYRRKTANARERHRMQVINTAFESLRRVLPDGVELCVASSTSTKISTLRHAVNYIRNLSDILDGDGEPANGGTSPDGDQFNVNQKEKTSSVVEPSSNYSLSQAVPQITNKNLLRCSRPPSLQYVQPSSYYFNSNQAHLANSSSKNYTFSSSSSSSVRGSLSSTSDLEELLSDDSEFLEDHFDVFNDIPSMTSNDPFEVLLEAERNCQVFTSA